MGFQWDFNGDFNVILRYFNHQAMVIGIEWDVLASGMYLEWQPCSFSRDELADLTFFVQVARMILLGVLHFTDVGVFKSLGYGGYGFSQIVICWCLWCVCVSRNHAVCLITSFPFKIAIWWYTGISHFQTHPSRIAGLKLMHYVDVGCKFLAIPSTW